MFNVKNIFHTKLTKGDKMKSTIKLTSLLSGLFVAFALIIAIPSIVQASDHNKGSSSKGSSDKGSSSKGSSDKGSTDLGLNCVPANPTPPTGGGTPPPPPAGGAPGGGGALGGGIVQ